MLHYTNAFAREETVDTPSPAVALSRQRAASAAFAGDHRADALWATAPWLAALSVGCALLVLWALRHALAPAWLGGWGGLVVAVNLVALRARRRAAGFGAPLLLRSPHWVTAEAGLHAALWGSLPAFAFAAQPSQTALLLGAALGTMIAGAFLLALAPVAATLWAVMLAGALLWAGHSAGDGAAAVAALLAAYLGVILTGCLTVERLLSRHMRGAADERARRETTELLLREYEEQGAGWLWQIDAANLLTYASPRLGLLLGRTTAAILGQPLPLLLARDARLGAALAERAAFTGVEIIVQSARGPRCIALSAKPVLGPAGDFQGFRGVGADVTEARRSEERLTHMASIDMLTGLPNRQRIRELLGEASARAGCGGSPCAILFLDLDGFKPVNDTFGHPIGDLVLQAVAERFAAAIGARGKIGRVGGDEFAIVLTEQVGRPEVEALAHTLIAVVADPFPFPSGEIRIGVSIGGAHAPEDGAGVDELILKADLALYEAKSRGRGTFLHFEPRMQRDAEARLRLENDLRQALRRGEFAVHYQPVVSAATQAVVGFEALLRWRHPERGMVPPSEFVPIAEETGLIAEIGEWVIQTACRDAMLWPDHIFVSVNLSARQLVIPALPNAVGQALAASRLQPGRLELEVTESVFMSDTDGSLDVLRRVRALGVGIALDDFGTGYSSLGYLNKTIFHTLKIDGSFVRDAGRRSETVSIIQAIVALARSFRMTVTAEGVETVGDFTRMQGLGCHKVQGYLFGRAVPREETLALVANQWRFGDSVG